MLNWLNSTGLSLDFLGFCLLLREWWLAFFHESGELELAKRRQWEQSLRHFSQSHMSDAMLSHVQTSNRVHDEMAARSAFAAHAATLSKRKRVFLVAAALIVLGFLLQLAASAQRVL
jgi:hypothetical protein